LINNSSIPTITSCNLTQISRLHNTEEDFLHKTMMNWW